MSKIERSIVIDRPIDAIGVGTQVRERRKFLGLQVEMTREITDYQPPTGSAFMVAGGAPLSGAYRLEPIDGGTSLTATGYVERQGFFKIAEPLFASMAGRELEASLGHLKDLLETTVGRSLLSNEALEAFQNSGSASAARRWRRLFW
jgi:hypothetical protein